jgi:hypothetical protein
LNFIQSNSVMNSLKYPKSKSLTHFLTELFPIYQNKYWTIRRREDCSVDPSSHRITLKIVGFLVFCLPCHSCSPKCFINIFWKCKPSFRKYFNPYHLKSKIGDVTLLLTLVGSSILIFISRKSLHRIKNFLEIGN